jgi:hypothetical protein
MAGFIERLNQELETFGRKAQAALDEGKLQLERLRLRREQDEAARLLGLLYHRKTRGQDTDVLEFDAHLVRLDNLATALARVDREIAAAKGEEVSVSDAPPPASTVPAEVVAQDQG